MLCLYYIHGKVEIRAVSDEKHAVNDENAGTFTSGFVGILGAPNAGKSTLMNFLVKDKIAIVTSKPQTTRHDIKAILTTDSYQMVFVDTPGIIQAGDKLNQSLMEAASRALWGIDVVYHVFDVATPEKRHHHEPLAELLLSLSRRIPRFLVINKIDLLPEQADPLSRLPEFIEKEAYHEIIPVSARTGKNIPTLLKKTEHYLPTGPLYYDPEQLTDREERFFVGEIVREKIYEITSQEIPYAVATVVDEFRENFEGKHYIRVLIYVERPSQKPIIIGSSGEVIKEIGRRAREDIEAFLEHPVFLDLWVKIAKNWRKRDFDLKRFGYKPGKK